MGKQGSGKQKCFLYTAPKVRYLLKGEWNDQSRPGNTLKTHSSDTPCL